MAAMAGFDEHGLHRKEATAADVNQKSDPSVIVIDEEGIARAKEQLCDVLVNGRIDLESLGVSEQIRDNDEMFRKVWIESHDWGDINLNHTTQELFRRRQCSERINSLACCFVNTCVEQNVIYLRKEALPKSLGRVMALEGVPHFVFAPGLDHT
nr:uncharacterized protein LOC109147873 [Ipomoea trifida]